MEQNTSLKGFLTVEPTSEQIKALDLSENFFTENRQDDFLIIRGSAGTGKSTLVKAITDYLTSKETKFVLAAPTAKAAKVIQNKTGFAARTIHSLIYKPEVLKHGCGVKMVRKQNQSADQTVFIIDEASMIIDVLMNNESFVASKPLLTDLIDYIKQGNKSNQVIFIGDVYQLPPINSLDSPALSPTYLTTQKGLKGAMVELTEVKRQDKDSYILNAATLLRNSIEKGVGFPGLECNMLNKSTSAIYKFMELYEADKFNKVTVLAWRNNDVNWFNNAIRSRLGFRLNSLSEGDQITLHANFSGNGRAIAKGESGIVRKVHERIEQFADINFCDVDIEFSNGVGEKFNVSTKVMLDVLTSLDGEIGFAKENALFAEVMKYNSTFRESKMPSDDKYIGAMRLRYGYAVTCHKAQGGEWENVILHPWVKPNDYRWLYTAITRASKELYSYNA